MFGLKSGIRKALSNCVLDHIINFQYSKDTDESRWYLVNCHFKFQD